MKKIVFYLTALMFTFLYFQNIQAQVPDKFLFQAEARDSRGRTLEEEQLKVKVNILKGEYKDTVYSEIHDMVMTDKNGLFDLQIGDGTAQGGDFTTIDWGNDTYFLNIKIAVGESENYSDMGTTQFLSVPYALQAKNVSSLVGHESDIIDLVEEGHNHALGQVLNEGNDAEGLQIQNLANPLNDQDAATKIYVDFLLNVIENNGLTVVDFESDKQSVAKNCAIQFNDLSKTNATSWLWDFNDGNTSTEQNPVHAFQEDGIYAISLTITNNVTSITETKTDYIQVVTNVQKRLDCGETPIQIYQGDNNLLDSLYGKYYQGGIIYYLNLQNGTGFVAAPTDQSSYLAWGNSVPSGLIPYVYYGLDNTNKIVSYNGNSSNYAASICYNLDLNGYSDWFLPSLNELILMYENLHKNGHGNFYSVPGYNEYWCSYGIRSSYYGYAYFIRFNNDTYTYSYTSLSYRKRVRASRMFF